MRVVFQACADEKVPEVEGVMGHDRLNVLTAAVHLKMVKMINLMVGVFCHKKT